MGGFVHELRKPNSDKVIIKLKHHNPVESRDCLV